MRTGRCTRLTSGILALEVLLVVKPVLVTVVLDLVECSGDCVKKPGISQ